MLSPAAPDPSRPASFLQSAQWEGFLRAYGSQAIRSQGLLFLRSDLPARLGYGLAAYRCQPSLLTGIPAELARATYLRFEPQDDEGLAALRQLAHDTGFPLRQTLPVHPRQTLVKDISGSEEDVIASFKEKHRYNLRLAGRKGVRVETHAVYDEAVFKRFWSLLSATARRQGFATFPAPYYRAQWQALQGEAQASVLLATHEGRDLTGMLLLTYAGTATYLHGGSGDAGKEVMAPYALHLQAMRQAKALGCSRYDFWGTDLRLAEGGTWEAKEDERSWGTSRFKLGFGGEVIGYPGTWDLILKPFWYTLYSTGRNLRGRKRAFR